LLLNLPNGYTRQTVEGEGTTGRGREDAATGVGSGQVLGGNRAETNHLTRKMIS